MNKSSLEVRFQARCKPSVELPRRRVFVCHAGKKSEADPLLCKEPLPSPITADSSSASRARPNHPPISGLRWTG